jgi:hypothetical protein
MNSASAASACGRGTDATGFWRAALPEACRFSGRPAAGRRRGMGVKQVERELEKPLHHGSLARQGWRWALAQVLDAAGAGAA